MYVIEGDCSIIRETENCNPCYNSQKSHLCILKKKTADLLLFRELRLKYNNILCYSRHVNIKVHI